MQKKEESDSFLKKMDLNAVLIGIVAIVGIFLIPIVVTKCSIISLDVEKPNEIGDTIGGILSPFIGLISAILVYLTFREQIKANKIIQNQFDEQLKEKLELVEYEYEKSEIIYSISELNNFEFNGMKGSLAIYEVFEKLKKGENVKYLDSRVIFIYTLQLIASIENVLKKISNKHLLRQIEIALKDVKYLFNLDLSKIEINNTQSEDYILILHYYIWFLKTWENLKIKNMDPNSNSFGASKNTIIELDNLFTEVQRRKQELRKK